MNCPFHKFEYLISYFALKKYEHQIVLYKENCIYDHHCPDVNIVLIRLYVQHYL